MIKAVIFDMDGTMVNTEDLWKDVNSELAKSYGKTFDMSTRAKMMGRKEEDAIRIFKDHHKLSASIDELFESRNKLLFNKIHKVTINPGLIELINLIDGSGLKKAIATSTYKDFAMAVLNSTDLAEKFSVIITGDMIQNGKPRPDIFLEAASELETKPENCLVIEDSENGVEAGHNAGMKVIAVPHEYSKAQDFSKADKIVGSLKDINERLINYI